MGDMAGSDDIWRTATWVGMGLAALLYAVGGIFTRIAGAWRLPDGLVMELKQAGPFVWGHSTPKGGRQTYRGQAVWGRVRLRRCDYGIVHLKRLGFDDDQAKLVEGRETGHFRLRRTEANLLTGDFIGFAFSFDDPKGPTSRPAEPVPRRLTRT